MLTEAELIQTVEAFQKLPFFPGKDHELCSLQQQLIDLLQRKRVAQASYVRLVDLNESSVMYKLPATLGAFIQIIIERLMTCIERAESLQITLTAFPSHGGNGNGR